MHGAWVRFAATGNPNGGDLPAWPEYNLERRAMVVFDVELDVVSLADNPDFAAWEAVPDDCLSVY
jgi:para-nitrobenzyl esterase